MGSKGRIKDGKKGSREAKKKRNMESEKEGGKEGRGKREK